MAANGERLLGLYDELTTFLTVKRKARKGSKPLALFLQLYNGHSWTRATGNSRANTTPKVCPVHPMGLHNTLCTQYQHVGLYFFHHASSCLRPGCRLQDCASYLHYLCGPTQLHTLISNAQCQFFNGEYLLNSWWIQPVQQPIEQSGSAEVGLSQRFLWLFPKPIYSRFGTLEAVNNTFTDKISTFCYTQARPRPA